MYRLNPVYNMDDFHKDLVVLEKKHGKANIARVIKYAKIVYCENDLYEIETILTLEEKYGQEEVKKAFDLVSSYKAVGNSKKSMRYVVGVLKKESKE